MKKKLLTLVLIAFAIVANAQRYVGGDISLLPSYEQAGARYYDHSGNSISDMLSFFKIEGMNAMRVRLFVDPTNALAGEKGEGVCQDLDYVKALGKRIKDAGFKLMLDFHYSDVWADPAKQWTPKSWLGLTDAQLQTKIYDYTKDALQQMVAAGAAPDFIQTGNEISYGMLYGEGVIKTQWQNSNGTWGYEYQSSSSTYKKYYAGQSANAARFFAFLKKAGEACREVCPQAKIVLHTERVPKPDYLKNFYTDMKNNGIDYDIIGLSYYPYYHGNLDQLETALATLESNFADKDIMIVEVGYYHDYQPETVTYDLSAVYPISDAGQKKFTDALIAALESHPQVKGLFWWMMEANEYGIDWSTKRVTDGWYNAGLFSNSTGRACSALTSLKDFLGTSGIDGVASDRNANGSQNSRIYNLQGQQLQHMQHGINIVNGKKVMCK